MNLRIRRIERARDFMALAPLWSKLANESGQLSPFLSYDWFWCCWHGVWPRRRPEILVVEEAGSAVAIIPLMHWKERLGGLPVRCLGFLEYPGTPMVDLLTLVAHDVVVETFLHHLAGRSDWDVVWLQKLPDTSPTLKALERILPERLAWRRAGNCLWPYLTISADWESSDATSVIAMEYQLRADGKALALWADDDPVYQELLSAHVLNLAVLRSLFERERGCIHEYGTGPGVKTERLWRPSGCYETVHLKLYRPSLYSRLLYRVDRGPSQDLGGGEGTWPHGARRLRGDGQLTDEGTRKKER